MGAAVESVDGGRTMRASHSEASARVRGVAGRCGGNAIAQAKGKRP